MKVDDVNALQAYLRKHIVFDKDKDCWLWQRKIDSEGYGFISWKYQGTTAHRWSYRAFKGVIPEGLVIDHLCRVRQCVNPDHLEAVSHRENVLRGIAPSAVNSRKTHCIRGHSLSPENCPPISCGTRHCRTCERFRRRYRLRVHVVGPAGHALCGRTSDYSTSQSPELTNCKLCRSLLDKSCDRETRPAPEGDQPGQAHGCAEGSEDEDSAG